MHSLHFLVLTHDVERRDELLRLLRGAGGHAAAAPDALSAAEALSHPGFDLLVLDLAEPDLDLATLRVALAPATSAEPEPLESMERRHIARALQHTGGNKRQAALVLGISRSTLHLKARKYGLDRD